MTLELRPQNAELIRWPGGRLRLVPDKFTPNRVDDRGSRNCRLFSNSDIPRLDCLPRAAVLAISRTARYCRTGATVSELLSLVFKGWGACSDNWNEHHDRQDDDRIGRGNCCRVRSTDERIRSRKQAESRNTKAGMRDGNCRHSELGEAKGANLWPCWSSWPSHQASKVSRQAATESKAATESRPTATEPKPMTAES
jgi:hypothetical protein